MPVFAMFDDYASFSDYILKLAVKNKPVPLFYSNGLKFALRRFIVRIIMETKLKYSLIEDNFHILCGKLFPGSFFQAAL